MLQFKSVGLALTATIALAMGAAAQDYPGGAIDPHQHGFEHGYRDGFNRGRVDHHQDIAYNFQTEEFRLGDVGYQPYMGSHEAFVDGYREGYKSGYDDGFNQRQGRWVHTYGLGEATEAPPPPPPPGSGEVYESRHWGYQDVAYDIGYRDGLAYGTRDAANHRGFRPEKNDRYEDADHGYFHGYGDKGAYKQEYRRAFVRGYQDGFGR